MVQILSNELRSFGRLLESLDTSETELTTSTHPEVSPALISLLLMTCSHQAPTYRQRYSKFRINVCNSLKAIVSRTMEKAERTLALQADKARRNLRTTLERQKYVSRLTNVATAVGDGRSSRLEPDEPDDPFGLGGDEHSSFLPARWYYIKYR